MDKAKQIGLDAYETELNAKVQILQELLENYNDGRRKNFYCLAIGLLELEDINLVMERIGNEAEPQATLKEKAATAARLFQDMAEERDILLKLRK